MSDFKITGPGFYKTRDGAKAEIVGQDSHGIWLGAIDFAVGTWTSGGVGRSKGAHDLIAPWTEPKKGTVWVNVYEGHCHGHTTRADADEGAGKSRLACVSVNWTEGEGL